MSRGTPRVGSVPGTRACGVPAFASTLLQVMVGRVHAAGCHIGVTIAEAVVDGPASPKTDMRMATDVAVTTATVRVRTSPLLGPKSLASGLIAESEPS